MGKLNYSKRKSEGVRLGQIVAKDLRKKYMNHSNNAPLSITEDEFSANKAHASPTSVPLLELNLDSKNLTDRGVEEMVAGLQDVLAVRGSTVHVRLHSLNLCGNQLNMKSLAQLSPCIKAAANTLEELDISSNNLEVANQQDASDWEHFLSSIADCSAIRKLNMAKNRLGGLRSMEIFCRVHTKHFKLNCKRLAHIDDEQGPASERETTTTAITARLPQIENLNLRDLDLRLKSPTPKGSVLGSRDSRQKASGIMSTQCIMMQENELNDCGALFLSYVLTQRSQLADKYPEAMPLRSSANGPSESCGIVHLPNDKLSSYGTKLLRLSETFVDNSNDDEDSSFDDGQEASYPIPLRKASTSSTHSRKVSIGSGIMDISQLVRTTIQHSSREEVDSLRRKLQRTALEESSGASSVELWRSALTMLSYVRRCVVASEPDTSYRKFSMPGRPRYSEGDGGFGQHLTTPNVVKVVMNPRESIDSAGSITRLSEGPAALYISKHSYRGRQDSSHNSSNSSSSHRPTPAPSPSDFEEIPQAILKRENSGSRPTAWMPENAWVRILGEVADPLGILSERQKRAVIKWGSNRRTLAVESDLLGKPKSIQIWKVLNGMGCFAYDEVE